MIYDPNIPMDIDGKGDITIGLSEIEISFTGITENIRIQADETNTGVIFIGKTGVLNDGSNSFVELEAGDELSLTYNDIINGLYAISDTASQKINAGATIRI